MIEQIVTTLTKNIVLQYDKYIQIQIEKLHAEYHLTSDEQLLILLANIQKEVQYNRIKRLLRNINLFIICRSLFGYMGLYNIYYKNKVIDNVSGLLGNKHRLINLLYKTEILSLKAMCIVLALLNRQNGLRQNYTEQVMDILLERKSKHLSTIDKAFELSIIILRQYILNTPVCIIFENKQMLKSFIEKEQLLYDMPIQKNHVQIVKCVYSLHTKKSTKHSINHEIVLYVMTRTSYVRRTMLELLSDINDDSLEIGYLYLYNTKTKLYHRNQWYKELIVGFDKKMFKKNYITHKLLEIHTKEGITKLLNMLKNSTSYDYLSYQKHKENFLDGLPDSVENKEIKTIQKKIIEKFIENSTYFPYHTVVDKQNKYDKRLSSEYIQQRLLHPITSLTDTTDIIQTNNKGYYDTYYKKDNEKLNFNRKDPCFKQKNILLFENAYDKYAYMIEYLRANKEFSIICIITKSMETLHYLSRILCYNQIKWQYVRKKKMEIDKYEDNIVYITTLQESYDLITHWIDKENILFLCSEYMWEYIASDIRHIRFLISKKDPFLNHNYTYPTENNKFKRAHLYNAYSKHAHIMCENTTSTIRTYKYQKIQKVFLQHHMHLLHTVKDMVYMLCRNAKQLLRHINTKQIIQDTYFISNKQKAFNLDKAESFIYNIVMEDILPVHHVYKDRFVTRQTNYKRLVLIYETVYSIQKISNSRLEYIKHLTSIVLLHIKAITNVHVVKRRSLSLLKEGANITSIFNNYLSYTLKYTMNKVIKDIRYYYHGK